MNASLQHAPARAPAHPAGQRRRPRRHPPRPRSSTARCVRAGDRRRPTSPASSSGRRSHRRPRARPLELGDRQGAAAACVLHRRRRHHAAGPRGDDALGRRSTGANGAIGLVRRRGTAAAARGPRRLGVRRGERLEGRPVRSRPSGDCPSGADLVDAEVQRRRQAALETGAAGRGGPWRVPVPGRPIALDPTGGVRRHRRTALDRLRQQRPGRQLRRERAIIGGTRRLRAGCRRP